VQVDKNIRALKDPMKKIVERHRYQNKQYDRHFRDCPSNDQKLLLCSIIFSYTSTKNEN